MGPKNQKVVATQDTLTEYMPGFLTRSKGSRSLLNAQGVDRGSYRAHPAQGFMSTFLKSMVHLLNDENYRSSVCPIESFEGKMNESNLICLMTIYQIPAMCTYLC